jgi:hypothetical protein
MIMRGLRPDRIPADDAPPAVEDVARQWAVLLSAVAAVSVAVLTSGAVVGTPVAEVAGGALSSRATLVAPAGPAFVIWSVIYVGLVLLALLQLTAARRTDPRQVRTGWWVATSGLLNACWVLVVQAEWIALSAVVVVALLVVLVVAVARLAESPPTSAYERLVVDGTLGLYLGWVCVATVANVAAALVHGGASSEGTAATVVALVVLAVTAGVGVLIAVRLGGRYGPALALAWGLAWIAVARGSGEPVSAEVAVAAAVTALVCLLAVVLVRARVRRPARSGPPTTLGT